MNGWRRLFLAAALLVAGLHGAAAQAPGEWVLARYRGGEYWYPGIIQGIRGDQVAIAYDDGDRETLPLAFVRRYTWAVGGRVECNWLGRGRWYSGTIAMLSGGNIGINYDDGDRERTTTGRCRSR